MSGDKNSSKTHGGWRGAPNLEFESTAHRSGYQNVAGVDEAGRGPLAGPVVVAGVILPEGFELDGLNDSKKLSESKRERLLEGLLQWKEKGLRSHVEVVSPEEIDRLNILHATWKGMRSCATNMEAGEPDFVLLDGSPVPDYPVPCQNVIKGDSRRLSIAAASIFAKVTRDRLMVELDVQHPEYGFAKHKGYPTKYHIEM